MVIQGLYIQFNYALVKSSYQAKCDVKKLVERIESRDVARIFPKVRAIIQIHSELSVACVAGAGCFFS